MKIRKERYALSSIACKKKAENFKLFRLKLTEYWRGPGGSMNSNLFESPQIRVPPVFADSQQILLPGRAAVA